MPGTTLATTASKTAWPRLLPEHTPLTEMNSLTRTAAYLTQRGTEATDAELDAYEIRK